MSTASEPAFTRAQVEQAANAGADLVRDGLDIGDRDTDLINLVVNATLTMLDEPGVSDLDDVIRRCYETEPAEVRGWWNGW